MEVQLLVGKKRWGRGGCQVCIAGIPWQQETDDWKVGGQGPRSLPFTCMQLRPSSSQHDDISASGVYSHE